MPLNTRGQIKRWLDQAQGNISWAVQHLSKVSKLNRGVHDDIADAVDAICEELATIAVLLDNLKDSI